MFSSKSTSTQWNIGFAKFRSRYLFNWINANQKVSLSKVYFIKNASDWILIANKFRLKFYQVNITLDWSYAKTEYAWLQIRLNVIKRIWKLNRIIAWLRSPISSNYLNLYYLFVTLILASFIFVSKFFRLSNNLSVVTYASSSILVL